MNVCSICRDATLSAAIAGLAGSGLSGLQISRKLGRAKSSVYRHLSKCAGAKSPQPAKRSGRGRSSKAGRLSAPLTPEEGLARLQRWLDRLDEMIFEAPKDIDRGTLLAIKAGVDLVAAYFKNAGWTQDGTIVTVDARSVTVSVESWSTPALQLIAATLSDDEASAAIEWLATRRRMALPATAEVSC